MSASPLANFLPDAMALKAALFSWTIADAVAALVVAFFCMKVDVSSQGCFACYMPFIQAAYLTNIDHLSPSLTV